jgi:NTP pyrophosphatase (non-canonical NTP hydrolase)
MTLNELQKMAHEVNKKNGWWDKPRNIGELLFTIVSELSEFFESYREDTLKDQCDKPIPLSKGEEEIADVMLRLMDFAESLGIDTERAIVIKNNYNKTRGYRHGGKKA